MSAPSKMPLEIGGRNPRVCRVSVVIVSFKDAPLLVNLLASLNKQTFKDYQVVLVDNAKDTDVRRIALRHEAIYIPNENSGYTGGNNLGVKHAKGELVLILNSDTWLERHALAHLVSFFDVADQKCMVVAPKIMIRNSQLINSIGMRRFHRYANLYSNVGYLERDRGQYDQPAELVAFDGAAFMFRRSLLSKTYLFNPSFFAGAESTDLAERIRKLGYRIQSCPRAVIRHEVHGTYKGADPLAVRPVMVRNNLAHTFTNLGIGALVMTSATLLHFCLVRIRNHDLRTAKQFLLGMVAFVLRAGRLIPTALAMARQVESY